LVEKTPFLTLLGHGSVRDEKGEEMHKSKGNAIWFDEAAEEMGVDVMRWIYLTTNPENNVNFGFHIADSVRRRFFLILWNVYAFFVNYASLDSWKPVDLDPKSLNNYLDKFIISRLNSLINEVKNSLSDFDAATAATKIENFVVNDLSTWYLRRSRDRMGPTADGKLKSEAYSTLYYVLSHTARLLAPFTPFVAEEIYRNLTSKESVHLEDFPSINEDLVDKKLEEDMEQVRQLAELGHSVRKEHGVKLRQPLSSFTYGAKFKKLPPELEMVLAQELNAKTVKYDAKHPFRFDWKITPELEAEGKARDLIREIQEKRKEAACRLDETVVVYLPDWPKSQENYIKTETIARELKKGKELRIERLSSN